MLTHADHADTAASKSETPLGHIQKMKRTNENPPTSSVVLAHAPIPYMPLGSNTHLQAGKVVMKLPGAVRQDQKARKRFVEV